MTGISLTFSNLSAATALALINLASGSGGAVGAVVAGNATADDDDTGPVNVNAPALDSNGLPWDERIHAKTKTQNKDGSWKKGKGVTAEMIAAVEAELRARSASPIPTAAPAQPGPFVPQVSPAAPNYGFQQPTAAPAQAAPPVHTPPMNPPAPAHIVQQPAPTPQPQPAQIDFNGLMMCFQRAMQAGLMDVNVLGQYVQEVNAAWHTTFTQITDVASRPEIVQWVVKLLERDNRFIAG